jgi:hypothetical protein
MPQLGVHSNPGAEEENRWEPVPADEDDLYTADIGPSPMGSVEFSLERPLPLGDYPKIGIKAFVNRIGEDAPNCGPQSSACTIIEMPVRAPLPQLSASWDVAASVSPMLVVKLGAQNLLGAQATPRPKTPITPTATSTQVPSHEQILLRVRASSATHEPAEKELYSSIVAADSKGTVNIDAVKIPVSQSFSDVCITAELVTSTSNSGVRPEARQPSQAACSLPASAKGVWLRLPVPEKMTLVPSPTPT